MLVKVTDGARPMEELQPETGQAEPEARSASPVVDSPPRWRRILVTLLRVLLALVLAWLLLAYVILPAFWRHYEHHPALENAPKTTSTPQGIPGDPLNVGLLGSERELVHAMVGSGWEPADPTTLRTSIRIAGSVVRNRPYPEAPVSSLLLFGRKQDLAFEKAAGPSARRRHHVRFWKSEELGRAGVPLWIGAVTFDRSVGLSHRTGQITHHIGADVDTERDQLIADLQTRGWFAELFQVTGVGATVLGRNGGGDRYYTDGEMTIAVLLPDKRRDGAPAQLANPAAVRIKDQFWSAIRPLLQSLPGT